MLLLLTWYWETAGRVAVPSSTASGTGSTSFCDKVFILSRFARQLQTTSIPTTLISIRANVAQYR